jgi:hypothetical protein
MARLLGHSPSTGSREIKRNGGYDRCRAAVADENAWVRSCARARAGRPCGAGRRHAARDTLQCCYGRAGRGEEDIRRTTLSVFVVQTDDVDLIEEMFSRLNEAVPLNAAEKRNPFGGHLPKIVRHIAATPFLGGNLSNKRYQHRDLAAKMVYLAHHRKIMDSKTFIWTIFS